MRRGGGGDDFERLWNDVSKTDLIGIVSPVYWLAPPGAMKDFIDRTHGYYACGAVLSGKKAFLVSIATESGFETHERVAGSWLQSYGAETVTALRLYAREKDDLRSSPDELRKLEEFGARLAGEA